MTCCRSLKPSQINLFTQGFPPAPASCRDLKFSLGFANIQLFQHVKMVGTEGAPKELQEAFKMSFGRIKKSHLITRSFRYYLIVLPRELQVAFKMSFGMHKPSNLVTISSQCSLFCSSFVVFIGGTDQRLVLRILSWYACRARWPDWGRMPLLDNQRHTYIYIYIYIYV